MRQVPYLRGYLFLRIEPDPFGKVRKEKDSSSKKSSSSNPKVGLRILFVPLFPLLVSQQKVK